MHGATAPGVSQYTSEARIRLLQQSVLIKSGSPTFAQPRPPHMPQPSGQQVPLFVFSIPGRPPVQVWAGNPREAHEQSGLSALANKLHGSRLCYVGPGYSFLFLCGALVTTSSLCEALEPDDPSARSAGWQEENDSHLFGLIEETAPTAR